MIKLIFMKPLEQFEIISINFYGLFVCSSSFIYDLYCTLFGINYFTLPLFPSANDELLESNPAPEHDYEFFISEFKNRVPYFYAPNMFSKINTYEQTILQDALFTMAGEVRDDNLETLELCNEIIVDGNDVDLLDTLYIFFLNYQNGCQLLTTEGQRVTWPQFNTTTDFINSLILMEQDKKVNIFSNTEDAVADSLKRSLQSTLIDLLSEECTLDELIEILEDDYYNKPLLLLEEDKLDIIGNEAAFKYFLSRLELVSLQFAYDRYSANVNVSTLDPVSRYFYELWSVITDDIMFKELEVYLFSENNPATGLPEYKDNYPSTKEFWRFVDETYEKAISARTPEIVEDLGELLLFIDEGLSYKEETIISDLSELGLTVEEIFFIFELLEFTQNWPTIDELRDNDDYESYFFEVVDLLSDIVFLTFGPNEDELEDWENNKPDINYHFEEEHLKAFEKGIDIFPFEEDAYGEEGSEVFNILTKMESESLETLKVADGAEELPLTSLTDYFPELDNFMGVSEVTPHAKLAKFYYYWYNAAQFLTDEEIDEVISDSITYAATEISINNYVIPNFSADELFNFFDFFEQHSFALNTKEVNDNLWYNAPEFALIKLIKELFSLSVLHDSADSQPTVLKEGSPLVVDIKVLNEFLQRDLSISEKPKPCNCGENEEELAGTFGELGYPDKMFATIDKDLNFTASGNIDPLLIDIVKATPLNYYVFVQAFKANRTAFQEATERGDLVKHILEASEDDLYLAYQLMFDLLLQYPNFFENFTTSSCLDLLDINVNKVIKRSLNLLTPSEILYVQGIAEARIEYNYDTGTCVYYSDVPVVRSFVKAEDLFIFSVILTDLFVTFGNYCLFFAINILNVCIFFDVYFTSDILPLITLFLSSTIIFELAFRETNLIKLNKLIIFIYLFIRAMFNIIQESFSVPYYFLAIFFIMIVSNIFFSNIFGMIALPTVLTAQLFVTFSLSLSIFSVLILCGIIFNKNSFMQHFLPEGVPVIIRPIVLPLEYTSFFSRAISLPVRLFANITAGHTLLKIFAIFVITLSEKLVSSIFIILLILVALTIIITLEFMIGGLQAYVFFALVVVYFQELKAH